MDVLRGRGNGTGNTAARSPPAPTGSLAAWTGRMAGGARRTQADALLLPVTECVVFSPGFCEDLGAATGRERGSEWCPGSPHLPSTSTWCNPHCQASESRLSPTPAQTMTSHLFLEEQTSMQLQPCQEGGTQAG
eukprot:2467917-Rhodomonas_salina.1